jgi:hypothetical protein
VGLQQSLCGADWKIGEATLESVVKIKRRKERWSGCGMWKQISYVSSFPFHLSFLSFSLYQPFFDDTLWSDSFEWLWPMSWNR